VECWAYFFRETVRLRELPAALDVVPFRDALEAATLARMTPEEWDAYDRARMAEQDARGAVSLAVKQGRDEGRAEGLAEAVLTVLAARGLSVSEVERGQLLAVKDAALLQRWLSRALTVTTRGAAARPLTTRAGAGLALYRRRADG
jgi:5-carboxymethyl-2-hydroxymuconate isomerase